MKNAARSTIDRAGRLVAGVPLRIEVVDGRIETAPELRRVRIVKRGGLKVAVAASRSEALSAAKVRETLESVRSPRSGGR